MVNVLLGLMASDRIPDEIQEFSIDGDVHKKNLGYDLNSLNNETGELRLIEVKGVGGSAGTIPLIPNERRMAEDRRTYTGFIL